MANLCGVNQKLIVEALSSVRRGIHEMSYISNGFIVFCVIDIVHCIGKKSSKL